MTGTPRSDWKLKDCPRKLPHRLFFLLHRAMGGGLPFRLPTQAGRPLGRRPGSLFLSAMRRP